MTELPVWTASLARMTTRIRDTFPESVAYTREVGGTVSITGIFDEAHQTIDVDPESGAQFSTTKPVLTVRLADLAFLPHVRDTLVIAGVTYQVLDVQPDGSGMAALPLRRA